MASLNWADVVEITHDGAKQTLLQLLDAVGFTATSWQEGEPALACVELSAEIWSQLSKAAVFLKGFALNSTSSGDALTRLSDSHFDNQREGAVTAQRRISLSCAAGSGPHTLNLGSVVIVHADGDTYRNVEDGVTVYPVVLSSGGSLSGLVFEAEVAGSAANKGPGSVTTLLTTLAGVTVTSDIPERDGSDAESDPVLKKRNTTKWALLTEFELIDDAVINIALTATQAVTGVVVDSTNPRGAGTFDVYMAGDLVTASASDITAAQDALDRRVFGSTDTPKTCLVLAAPVVPLNFSGTIYYKGSYTTTDITNATTAALEAYVATIPLGGFDFYPGPSHVVPVNDLEAALRAVQIAGQTVAKNRHSRQPSRFFGAGLLESHARHRFAHVHPRHRLRHGFDDLPRHGGGRSAAPVRAAPLGWLFRCPAWLDRRHARRWAERRDSDAMAPRSEQP
jgi:hypothetical protein